MDGLWLHRDWKEKGQNVSLNRMCLIIELIAVCHLVIRSILFFFLVLVLQEKKKKGKRKRKTMPFLFVLFANAYFRKISSEEGDINVLIRTL